MMCDWRSNAKPPQATPEPLTGAEIEAGLSAAAGKMGKAAVTPQEADVRDRLALRSDPLSRDGVALIDHLADEVSRKDAALREILDCCTDDAGRRLCISPDDFEDVAVKALACGDFAR